MAIKRLLAGYDQGNLQAGKQVFSSDFCEAVWRADRRGGAWEGGQRGELIAIIHHSHKDNNI